jgi:hypothetical protein
LHNPATFILIIAKNHTINSSAFGIQTFEGDGDAFSKGKRPIKNARTPKPAESTFKAIIPKVNAIHQ